MLAVVYIIATEAHAPSSGRVVVRVDLELEALRLAPLLVELMPDEPEALSLLALLLFTAARRPARVDSAGDPMSLADQDRSRWDKAAVEEGSARLAEAVRWSGGVARPYQLHAHLAACHSTAPTWADTDWDRIGQATLHSMLSTGSGEPININVELPEWGMLDGPVTAFYGHVSAAAVAHWHQTYGDAPFATNLHSTLPNTGVNDGRTDDVLHVADPPSSVDIRYSLDRIILTLEVSRSVPSATTGHTAMDPPSTGPRGELLGRIAPDLAGHLIGPGCLPSWWWSRSAGVRSPPS